MKRFLGYSLLFVLPILLFLLLIELLVHQVPTSYSYKYNYIKNKGDLVEAIAIGHSQLYDDFNPTVFNKPAFNLANSAQSYIDDYYLLKELLPYMPNLRIVILPIGYINAGTKPSEGLGERCVYYHEYMNIDYDGNIPFKYRLECLNPKKALSKIVSYYINKEDITRCDTLGQRNTSLLKYRQSPLGTEKLIDGYTRDISENFYLTDEEYLNRIVEMLQGLNIKIVLVSPPYYWASCSKPNQAQKSFVNGYATNYCRNNGLLYINMEDSKEYDYDDFFDESHLSEIGSEKFTKKLNEIIEF